MIVGVALVFSIGAAATEKRLQTAFHISYYLAPCFDVQWLPEGVFGLPSPKVVSSPSIWRAHLALPVELELTEFERETVQYCGGQVLNWPGAVSETDSSNLVRVKECLAKNNVGRLADSLVLRSTYMCQWETPQ